MRNLFPSLLAPALLLAPSAQADAPPDLYFDVYRNGTPFGEHVVRFEETLDGRTLVDIEIELSVRLGPITLFRYEHQAAEVWREGELIGFTSNTLRDGERLRTEIIRESADQLRSPAGVLPDLPPSSHWQGYAPGLTEILNTETGEPMDVEVTDLGPDLFEAPEGPVSARRYRMQGSLTVDLWYDETGRWIGCAFDARGQEIVYRLRDA